MNKKTHDIIELITLYMEGELSDEQQGRLTTWIQESEKNLQFFNQVRSREKLENKLAIRENIDKNEAFKRFKSNIQSTRTRISLKIARYAAAVILIAAIGLIFMLSPERQANNPIMLAQEIMSGSAKATLILAKGERIELSPAQLPTSLPANIHLGEDNQELVYIPQATTNNTIQYNKLVTPRGGEYKITLPDGTFVQLNSNTNLKFPIQFNAMKREVYLSGEAYFTVKEEKDRPFYVITDVARIKVHGTSFNVNTLLNNQVQTTLVNGSIGISVPWNKQEYLLQPHQQAEVNNVSKQIIIRDVDPHPYTAWKDGLFLFDDECLETIMDKLALWYDVELFYQNEAVKNIRFTGYLKRYENINIILDAIEATVSATFTIRGRTIMINQNITQKE